MACSQLKSNQSIVMKKQYFILAVTATILAVTGVINCQRKLISKLLFVGTALELDIKYLSLPSLKIVTKIQNIDFHDLSYSGVTNRPFSCFKYFFVCI